MWNKNKNVDIITNLITHNATDEEKQQTYTTENDEFHIFIYLFIY